MLERMSRTLHFCFAIALSFVCFGCCIFGLFAWVSTGAGPWGAGDAVRSVVILGGLFTLAGWGRSETSDARSVLPEKNVPNRMRKPR